MHKPKKRSVRLRQKKVDWLEYINEQPPLVIPVGSRFQADVPEWTGPSDEGCGSGDLDSKWLGTRMWPLQDDITVTEGGQVGKGSVTEGGQVGKGSVTEGGQVGKGSVTEGGQVGKGSVTEGGQAGKGNVTEGGQVGKGRPKFCSCSTPGSQHCMKRHISEEKTRLQADLGPAFESWKFDEMGEDVAKSWSSKQQKKFDSLVKMNPLSEGKSFLKPAESSFPSKTRKDIVNYYLNVYVPKRISMVTRSGSTVLDSDDDEVEEVPNAKSPLKRTRPSDVDSTTLAKSHYLIGRR